MNRRQFLAGAAGAAVTAAFIAKPADTGAAYTDYFKTLNEELRRHGPHCPCLVVDLDRTERNAKRLLEGLDRRIAYRIVAKSLPSPGLLGHVMKITGTRRLMVFHQPFISHVAASFPDADLLVGKPMPVGAAKRFYDTFRRDSGFEPSRQLQWLVDTPERLTQYHRLARSLGVRMRINVEIDVGLHRGGLRRPDMLARLLDKMLSDPDHLEFAGLMGYDPHVVKLPRILKSPDTAYRESQADYQGFIDLLVSRYPAFQRDRLCLNGAGSPTVALHKQKTVINDLAAGSGLVKPIDFDIGTLAGFEPAAFIATPVLKQFKNTTIPAVEGWAGVMSWWNPNWQQSFFIYGGKWKAGYVSPGGLRDNPLYGPSTNQQMVNGSDRVALRVDDHVFLRPNQSEFVFLQFGDILAVRGGRIVDQWPVLTQ